MKSLRILSLAFLLSALSTVYAADSKKESATTEKKSASSDKTEKTALPDTVAVVEGSEIKKVELEKEFKAALAASGKPLTDLTEQQKQQGYRTILDDMIIDRLLRKRSADEKVTDEQVDKTVQQIKSQFPSEEKMNEEMKKSGQTMDKVKENIRTSLKQQQWIEAQLGDKAKVTDADAQGFYDKNPDKFQMPASVRASHILFAVPADAKPDVSAQKEKLAKETEDRIKKGEDFSKLATELSDDPGSKATGGDLDFFTHDRMVPEFADKAFKMKVGEVSDPVKTQFGYHIIKVTDKKEAHNVPFPEAKEKILAYLQGSKKREVVNQLIASIREKADVKVNIAPISEAAASPATP